MREAPDAFPTGDLRERSTAERVFEPALLTAVATGVLYLAGAAYSRGYFRQFGLDADVLFAPTHVYLLSGFFVLGILALVAYALSVGFADGKQGATRWVPTGIAFLAVGLLTLEAVVLDSTLTIPLPWWLRGFFVFAGLLLGWAVRSAAKKNKPLQFHSTHERAVVIAFTLIMVISGATLCGAMAAFTVLNDRTPTIILYFHNETAYEPFHGEPLVFIGQSEGFFFIATGGKNETARTIAIPVSEVRFAVYGEDIERGEPFERTRRGS